VPGTQPIKAENNTHLAILRYFERNYPDHFLLSQPIGTDAPLDWLYSRRVIANYTNSGFGEPDLPDHFERIVSVGVRQSIEAYLSDSAISYVFDADHATLAFPLTIMKLLCKKLVMKGLHVELERIRFLRMVAFKDRRGPMSKLQPLLF